MYTIKNRCRCVDSVLNLLLTVKRKKSRHYRFNILIQLIESIEREREGEREMIFTARRDTSKEEESLTHFSRVEMQSVLLYVYV